MKNASIRLLLTSQEAITANELTQSELPGAGDPSQVRQRKLEATQHLLGDTIRISDIAWQEPSRLPGWTRAHIATHLARNADALAGVVEGALTGRPTRLYAAEADRERDIERGSERTPLELQFDLDTSAGRLHRIFDAIDASNGAMLVELTQTRRLRLDLLPLARLNEVVLHHVDLDCGFELADIEDDIAGWLLAWTCYWAQDRTDLPSIQLHADSGFDARLGAYTDPIQVSAPDWLLVGWLTGRLRQDEQRAKGLPLLPSLASVPSFTSTDG